MSVKETIQLLWAKLFLKARSVAIRNSKVDKTAKPNSGSNIVDSTIGRFTYTGYDCWIIATSIGSFCSISNNVRIGGPSHPVEFVSTSPVFVKGQNQLKTNIANHLYNPFKRTVIGSDVWIGENAIICAGISIGDGAVVGTGSVVTKNIPPFEIWAGNPARFIRKRFEDEVVAELLKIQWWNLTLSEIENCAHFFNNPRAFIDYYNKK